MSARSGTSDAALSQPQPQQSHTDATDLVSDVGAEMSMPCGDENGIAESQHSHTDSTDLVSAVGVEVSDDNEGELGSQRFHTDSGVF